MSTLYNRALLNNPEVSLAYSDPLIGLIEPDEVTLEFSNSDHYFDTLDLRGERITYDRLDKLSNETWAEMTGKVVSQELLADRAIMRCLTYDLDVFQTLLPKEVVTAAVFPKADPEQGLGKAIPIIFGIAGSTNKVNDAWEMPWVGDDTAGNLSDYLVGRGTYSNVSVYRNAVGEKLFLVPGSEYTVNTSAYPGFTVIRFARRQRNFSGGFHRLFVAADPATSNRNFADAIKFLLNDSTQGLALSANAASFTAAASDLTAVGSLYCDGAITEQRPAIDYINQLLIVRGMKLGLNSSGEYTLTVDKAQSIVKGKFGHGIGQAHGGVKRNGFKGLSKTPRTEMVKTLILDYRYDRWSQRHLLATSARPVLPVGADKRIQNDFIRDRTTADKCNAYWALRHIYGDDRLAFEAGQMARKLMPGDLIGYESMQPSFNKIFLISRAQRGLTDSSLNAVGWSTAIFDYTAGTLPAEPAANTDTDYSRSTPTAASSLSIISSGTEPDGQGGFAAYVVLQYTVPDEPWAQTIIRKRRIGVTSWEAAGGPDQVTGTGKQTEITGLITGQSYDYQVSRVNLMDSSLSADVTLSNQTAPADTSAPTAPSAIAVRQAGGKAVEIDLTFTAPPDWDVTILYRNTTNNSGTAVEIERGQKKRFHDQNVSYGTTYYYWAKVKDYSGNLSGFSPSSSHSVSVATIVTDDIADEAIISSSEVSASNLVSTASSSVADMPNMSITKTFTGGKVRIQFYADAQVDNDDAVTGPVFVNYFLNEDGVDINGSALKFHAVPSGEHIKTPIEFDETRTPSAGSHTYKIRWKINSISIPNTFKVRDRRLITEERKK